MANKKIKIDSLQVLIFDRIMQNNWFYHVYSFIMINAGNNKNVNDFLILLVLIISAKM